MDPLQLDLSESFSLEEFQLTYPMCSKELNVEGRKAHFPWISIKKSIVPGANYGVFADKTFLPNEMISVYKGTRLFESVDSDFQLKHG